VSTDWVLCAGNHYQVLQVPFEASPSSITTAFKKLSLKVHPDKNQSDPDASQKFGRIKQACEILTQTDERYMYDISIGQRPYELEKRSNKELMALCSSLSLPKNGAKAALLGRLNEHYKKKNATSAGNKAH